ncbi:MAG TPA: phenylacetate--CoA ligase [Chloroflexota bacterium]|nr:phenylacetate--CoA ligase [Chloroflexota bacterium]
MIWDREAESLPRERLQALQLDRLRQTIDRQLSCVPPRAEALQAAGVHRAQDLRSLADLAKLPFTRKTDLRENYPFGLFAVPRREIIRIHASSGTRGKPTVVGYTRADLQVWSEVMARTYCLAGVEPGMVVHNAYGYGLFTGGFGFHMGAELMGCMVVPMSGGFTQRQVLMLEDLSGQVLCATPSYALNIAQALAEQGISRERLELRVGIFGAEPWTEQLRDELERQLDIAALNVYGLSEIVGPGVSAECIEERNGAHIQEDHFLVEVIDPDTEQPLPPGREGELVFSTLTKQALPMVRYRTGDISSIDVSPCSCGRTTVRMARVRGRYDDMLIIRGVNLYPSEVERVLLTLGDVAPHYQLLVERPGAMDELTVLCEPAVEALDIALLQQRIARTLHAETGLSMVVQVLERGAVPRSEGKAVRVVDKRPRSD